MKDYIKKRISEQQEICLTLSKDAMKRAQKIFEKLQEAVAAEEIQKTMDYLGELKKISEFYSTRMDQENQQLLAFKELSYMEG